MSENQVEVVFCEGWAPGDRALVGRIGVEAARHRHTRGEQYAVALVDAAGPPRAVLEIAWGARFARGWHVDEHGRRTRRIEYRVLRDGRLFLLRDEQWGYPTPELPEFDDRESRHIDRYYSVDGRCSQEVQERGLFGGTTYTVREGSVDELIRPVPEFGDWLALAGLDEPTTLQDSADPVAAEAVAPPWQPPVPLQPFALHELFVSGTRVALPDHTKEIVTVDVRPGGTLRLPSGRLVTADANMVVSELEPFAATVEPGAYPVELALVRFSESTLDPLVAAAKVVVSPEPAVSWELALCPDRDPVMLFDQSFYGVTVDSGLVGFLDADGLAPFEELLFDDDELFDELNHDLMIEVGERTSGTNVIAFRAGHGDGVYPTWLGRTATGAPAAFVLDTLLIHGGELV